MLRKRSRNLLTVINFVAVLTLTACGGSGGGGTDDQLLANSRAHGVFTYALIKHDAASLYPVETVRGTLTFNGDGTASFTEVGPSGPGGELTYTVSTDNVITLQGFGMVGTLRAGGDFFAASDVVADGGISMMIAVKNTAGADESLLTGGYIRGYFTYDDAGGESATAVQDLSCDGSGSGIATGISPTTVTLPTFTYTIEPDGYLTKSPEEYGAASAGGDLAITADTSYKLQSAYPVLASLSLKKSSGKTKSDLSGAYDVHLFLDDLGAFGTSRATVLFDGNGAGTFSVIATSFGSLNSGPFSYSVDTTADNGTFMLDNEGWYGMMSPDASVIAVIDTDASSSGVRVMVGVKK